MKQPRKSLTDLLKADVHHGCPPHAFGGVCVKIVAVADLPTRFGQFQIVAFHNNKDGKEHAALVKGCVINAASVPVRLHSECLTGDALGSLRCDCRSQLISALKYIGVQENGIVLYLRQEGRGIGFINKIKAYAIQDLGYDTVEADQLLGFSGDEREYNIAAHMLHSLKVKSIKLITNNPKKINDLVKHDVTIVSRIPLVTIPNKYNRAYLDTKRLKAGHLFPPDILEQAETFNDNVL